MSLGKLLKSIQHIVSENKIATALLSIALFLRFYKLDEFTTFLGDQGRDAIIVKRIVTFEHFPAIGPTMSIGQVFLGPFYYYLVSPFLLLFNFNPVGLSYGIAILSLIGLGFAYFAMKQVFNKTVALFFLILATFSFVNIEFSRFSWNPNLLPIFSFATLYFFYRFLHKNSRFDALAFGGLLSLSLQLHYLAALLLVPIGIVGLKELVFNSKKVALLKNIGLSLLSFLFFYIPLIIFDLRHEFLNSKSLLKLFTNTGVVGDGSSGNILETNKQFFSHVLATDINPYAALSIFVAIAVFFVANKFFKKNIFLQLHFLAFISYILFFSLLTSHRFPHYYNAIYYSFFVIVSYILYSLPKAKYLHIIVAAIILSTYIFINAKSYYFIPNVGSHQIKRAETIADAIIALNPQVPYQISALPFTEIDGHVRYFLELKYKRPLSEESIEQPKELYVLCYEKECEILNNGQWQIAFFQNKKIDTIVTVLGIKIYKVVHEK